MVRTISSLRMLLVEVMVLSLVFEGSSAAGAGRAFPIAAENYVIQNFQRINRRLNWDPTNFLIDLSGQYANCIYSRTRDFVRVDRDTPEGDTIAAYVDYTDGANADVNSVNGYLQRVIDRWISERRLDYQIRDADRFGCSVAPGCPGSLVVVSCLFSPAGRARPEEPPPQYVPAEPKALAFTPEQYRVAEGITRMRWDRSHLLENLSGLETDCGMIGNNDWQFTKAHVFAKKYELHLFGIYGFEPNYGSTPEALEKILKSSKRVSRAKGIGCSLIPDCMYNGQMYVVVSCIYEESP